MSDTREGASREELDDLVAEADTGARDPSGPVRVLILTTACAWSLFQLWIASPLPFMVGWGVFGSNEARSIHLALALFLCYLAFPAPASKGSYVLGLAVPLALGALFFYGAVSHMQWYIIAITAAVVACVALGSPRDKVAPWEWVLAIAATFCALYLFIFYQEIANRVGAPITQDMIVGAAGLMLLLEATRRSLGPALVLIATLFLAYAFLGRYAPSIIAHQGVSLSQVVNHQWITTEGVFGIALGVSTDFVFLFVLFGALLDKAGAGNYFIQVVFSLMGHLRGGPAKAAVVSSALTGMISGSSIANVVTTGTFTIPLMKKVGFKAEKAGAVEVASSVNGQLMPPVMGAAAFLMVEYVGIPYFDVVKHAILPAVISYIALVYLVHLEAMKQGMKGMERAYTPPPLVQYLMGLAIGIVALCALSFAVYYGMGWVETAFGAYSGFVVFGVLVAAYLGLLFLASRHRTPAMEDLDKPGAKLPLPGPTVKSGLHFVLPVIVLVYALMVERMSPGLSAFWAAAFMIFILLTQRLFLALFRGELRSVGAAIAGGAGDLVQGLVAGARNMIGIAIATATAGIIVGTVTQTGVGTALADVVEVLSGGYILAILALTAVLSLILGMGLPTTANYIVVSALLAPVIVTLGEQNGLLVPLIAVHLFVFYFGIMADVTPPVGLASFASAAVSGGDPIKTGVVAFFYSLRTVALPFLFIFNTDLLLIDVTWYEGVFVFVVSTVAMLLFAAAMQGFFLARSKIWETVLLLLVAFTLFRPGYWMDMIAPPFEEVEPARIEEAAANVPAGGELRLNIAGTNQIGEPITFTTLLPIPEGEGGAARLEAAGLTLVERDGKVIIDNVAFGSPAEDTQLDWDQEILSVLQPQPQPSKYWMFIPALLILALVVALQRLRLGLPAMPSFKPAPRAEPAE
ncbi:MAG: TRAP transporter permease [Paracoccaceae bacterium]